MNSTSGKTEKPPHPVDRHVGDQIRTRRKALRLSQGVVAETVGITFQQLQKYERGDNRVSASRLHQIAGALFVPINFFFDGLETAAAASENTLFVSKTMSRDANTDAIELLSLWPDVKRNARKTVLDLVRGLAAPRRDAA